MLIRKPADIRSSEITDESLYLRRREFMQASLGAAAGLALGGGRALAAPAVPQLPKLEGVRKGPFGTAERQTPYEDITSYNNFYEFGTDKESPARSAGTLRTRPWTVKVDGEVGKPADFTIDDLVKPGTLEERVYRLRCVEGWSMVIPWVGFPLADVLKRAEPTTKAEFVEFATLHDPKQMPGQRSSVLRWPYVE